MPTRELAQGDTRPLVIGAALGNCVHVAGVANFLRMAEGAGFATKLLGAATPVSRIVAEVNAARPLALAVSYRLTPESGRVVLRELLDAIPETGGMALLFGGIPEMAEYARETGRFAAVFTGDEAPSRVARAFAILRGEALPEAAEPGALVAPRPPVGQAVDALTRLGPQLEMPLLRHHFGLPSLEATVEGVKQIAMAEALDVISIAPDQNAQEFFFRPEQMVPALDGAGGVPLRRPEHLARLREAARCGNHPYLRIYSGTQDLPRWARLSLAELGNAWGTIPLTWYSELDGRSQRALEQAISENQETMRLYADAGCPVEVNEAHHWSLREAPDAVATAMAYIAAYNARHVGVRRFFAQYMFNTPAYTSPIHDLAKMVAKLRLIESLRTDTFLPYRQVRAGLSHFSPDLAMAKGQLAASTMTMLALRPQIVHVVGFTEADHAASAEEVIESCGIVRGVLRNRAGEAPEALTDPRVAELSQAILSEALVVIGTITRLGEAMGVADPLTSPDVLATAIRTGLLDAPHLAGQQCACGAVRTMPLGGGCSAVDDNGRGLPETQRLRAALAASPVAERLGLARDELVGPPALGQAAFAPVPALKAVER